MVVSWFSELSKSRLASFSGQRSVLKARLLIAHRFSGGYSAIPDNKARRISAGFSSS
jgi:hypothetical protein